MTSSQQIQEKNGQISLRLFDFYNLLAKTFYQIMETDNQNLLLMENKSQLLLENQQNEVQQRWLEIQETYHSKTNKEKYIKIIGDQSYELDLAREMMILDGCEMLMNVGIGEYKEPLSRIGITGTDEQIVRLIAQKRMMYKHHLMQRQKENQDQADSDFYSLVAMAGTSLGYHIPANLLLAEWCGILNILNKQSDARSDKKE